MPQNPQAIEFGLFSRLPYGPGTSHAQAVQEHLAMAQAAEELGYDTFWQAHEQFQPEIFLGSAPLCIASAIAATTSRLRIGTAVLQLALDHPLRVAQDVATADQISQGRIVLGVGRGGFDYPYQPYKIPYAEGTARNREALQIIRKAWTQERFSHSGQYWSFDDVSAGPKPYQQPHPPIALAGVNPETFTHAGNEGYILFINGRTPQSTTGTDQSRLRAHCEEYRRAWRKAGHQGNGHILSLVGVYVAETAKQAYSEPEATTMRTIRFFAKWTGTPLEGLSEEAALARAARTRRNLTVSYDEVFRTDVAFGTAEAVREKLRGLQEEFGLSGFIMDMNAGGLLPQERVINSMRLFADHVGPYLR